MSQKKIKEIFIGSNNQGKLKEIADLLPKNIKIFSNLDYKISSPKEIGKTFKQNSLLKAEYFSKKTKKISLSDDSGLEVDILDKAPGIYSADWAGRKRNFNLAINKLYKKILDKDKNWKNKKIKARFICVLTIYWPNGNFISKTGKVEGYISKTKKGNNGFGYDPLFIPDGQNKTFAEMNIKQKNKFSHRAIAIKKLIHFLIH